MRKLLAIAGAVAGAVGTGVAAAAANRQRRRQRFYVDVRGDLLHTLTYYRARLNAAAHEDVVPDLALALLGGLPGFVVSQEDLRVTAFIWLPSNRDITRIEVTLEGLSDTLDYLRDRLLDENHPQVSAEGMGSVSGGELRFKLIVCPEAHPDAEIVRKKLAQVG